MSTTSGDVWRASSTASLPFAGFADDDEVVVCLEDEPESTPDQGLVVGDKDADRHDGKPRGPGSPGHRLAVPRRACRDTHGHAPASRPGDDAAASSVIDITMRLPAISRAVASTPAKPPTRLRRDARCLGERRPERRLPQPPGQRHIDQHVDQHPERTGRRRAASRRRPPARRAARACAPSPSAAPRCADCRGRRCRGSEAARPAPRTRRPCRGCVSSTTACQTSSVSVTNSTPQPSEHSMNSTMPNWMMRRGIEAVVERARPDREQQERQPVRDHRKAAERRRLELLVDDPVADDVLDGVRHHRQHGAAEIGAVAGLAQRSEGAVLGLGLDGVGQSDASVTGIKLKSSVSELAHRCSLQILGVSSCRS